MSLETAQEKRLADLDDAAKPLRLRGSQRGKQTMAPAPSGEAADRRVIASDDSRQGSSARQMGGVARPESRLAHSREGRAAERIEGAPAAVRFVDLDAAKTLATGAVAPVAHDPVAAAMRTFALA